MFCQKCGTEIPEGARFCERCGNPMDVYVSEVTQAYEDEEIVDLSGQADATLPQTQKYKPILHAGIAFCFVWILYAIAGSLFYNFVMERSSGMLIVAFLFVSIPFILIFIPFLLKAKKKTVGIGRKIGNGEKMALYSLTWFTTSLAIVMGFADAFSEVGLLPTFTKILFVVLVIVFLVTCNAFSNQCGEELYYAMFKALFSGFIVAIPLGNVLGQILRMFELGLIILLVCFVLFIVGGGSVIFVRYRD